MIRFCGEKLNPPLRERKSVDRYVVLSTRLGGRVCGCAGQQSCYTVSTSRIRGKDEGGRLKLVFALRELSFAIFIRQSFS